MRILYIGNHLSNCGAYPSVAESLAPYLNPEVELHLVSRLRNKFIRGAHMLFAIFRYGRQRQPVLIDVFSTLNFWYALLCGLACRGMRIRYCCVLHGGNLPIRLKKNPLFCRWLFGGAYRLIAPSHYLRNAFRKQGYDVMVIPNGIALENYPYELRENIRPRLLWVRAFDATYNPQMAIKVFQKIHEMYPDAELCMVGPDKDGSMATCKALTKDLGLSGRVAFTGRLSKTEWISLSEQFDIFISTTNFDNTPVSVIEAMALGLCVVSTNVGGVPYLLTDDQTGLLVEKGDESAMVRQIQRLFIEPDLAARISRGGREKAEGFSWEKVVPLWLDQLKT